MINRFVSYYKPHKKLFVIDMICAFFMALLSLLFPYITGDIINTYAPEGNLTLLLLWSGILMVAYLVKAGLNYYVLYWGHIMGVRMQGDMRKDFFNHIQHLPFSFFDETKTGTIMSRIINDLQEVAELAHHGPEDLFLSLVTLVGALILIGFINMWLVVIIVVVLPFMFIFAIRQRRSMVKSFGEMRKETGEINANVESAVSGVRVSRAYTATEHEIDKFDHANNRFMTARGKAYRAMANFGCGMGLFVDLLYLVAVASGGLFLLYEQILAGDYAAYILYISMITTPIKTLTAIFESIQSGMTGFARFTEIMEKPIEEEEPEAIELGKPRGSVRFNNVSFRYNGNVKGDKLVLDDVSLHIKSGTTVALVGPSGGGKTTLCHLIPRFYELNSGNITIDDIDITQMSRISLRRNIGIVAQDVFLFSGSIRENIAYGRLDATDEDIYEAAKKANIHEYILTMPDGYDTEVGERGVKLSGGQKQRVSIARAFLKNPKILILDEATSALDTITELQIQHSLEELSKDRTTIVVAHRLSTIKNADEIVVVTSDGIAERGSHQQLLELGGEYANLYNNQFRYDQR